METCICGGGWIVIPDKRDVTEGGGGTFLEKCDNCVTGGVDFFHFFQFDVDMDGPLALVESISGSFFI